MESTLARALTFPTLRNLWARAAVRRVCYALIVILTIDKCIDVISTIQEMGMDLQQDYLAVQLMMAGDDIFRPFTTAEVERLGVDATLKTGMWQNAHPPTAILLFTPFALGSFLLSATLWTLFSALLVSVLVLQIARTLAINLTRAQGCVLGLILLNWYPVTAHLFFGQWSLLLAVLCMAALRCLQTGRDGWAGVLVATAAVIKIYPLLLLGYGLWRWRPRFVGAGILTGLVLFGLSLFAGSHQWERYVTYAIPETLRVYHNTLTNVGLSNLASRIFTGSEEISPIVPFPQAETPTKWLLFLLTGGAMAATLWKGRWREDIRGEWILLLCATSVFSPISWQHNMVLFLPAFVLLWQRTNRKSTVSALILIIAGLLSNTSEAQALNTVIQWFPEDDFPAAVSLVQTSGMFMAIVTVTLIRTLWKQAHQTEVPCHV